MPVPIIRDLIDTQDQLNPRDSLDLVFKLFNDQLPDNQATVKLINQEIGNAFIAGHAVNGVCGTSIAANLEQVTVGGNGLGVSTVRRVFSRDNQFFEPLRDTEYFDTGNTTATIDTTDFVINF